MNSQDPTVSTRLCWVPGCNIVISRPSDVARHIRETHGPRLYCLYGCDYDTMRESRLWNHYAKKHTAPLAIPDNIFQSDLSVTDTAAHAATMQITAPNYIVPPTDDTYTSSHSTQVFLSNQRLMDNSEQAGTDLGVMPLWMNGQGHTERGEGEWEDNISNGGILEPGGVDHMNANTAKEYTPTNPPSTNTVLTPGNVQSSGLVFAGTGVSANKAESGDEKSFPWYKK